MSYAALSINSPSYEDSFPLISDHAKKKFGSEFSTLKNAWQKYHQFSEQTDREEATYKEGIPCRLYDNHCVVTSIGGFNSVAGIALTIFSAAQPLISIPSIFATVSCGLFACSPYLDQEKRLNGFNATREATLGTLEKIEKCVAILNKTGELFAVWEIAKEDSSEDNLNLLFKNFKKVQKAEKGLTANSIKLTEPLLLMDNLCVGSRTDQKLINEWKEFVRDPGLKIWEEEELQPIEIFQVKASSETYSEFFKIRNAHSENQIEKKVVLIREYINKEFSR